MTDRLAPAHLVPGDVPVGPERPFTRIVELAALVMEAPMAGVGLLGETREVFVARAGPLFASAPREETLCEVAWRDRVPLVVPDARADARFADLPCVAGAPGIRGYLGHPLGGERGVLCIADTKPRAFDGRDVQLMAALARLASGELTLRRIALRDALTGLLSRRAWYAAARRAEGLAARGQDWSVLCIDLDRFKEVNDTHGHAAGDAVLQEVGARVSRAVRSGEAVGRIGGDEFAVAIQGGRAHAARLAARVARALGASPAVHDGTALPLSASIGTARIGPAGLDAAMEEADAALYRAKSERGRAA